MTHLSQGSVESVISELGSVAPPGCQNFELWVPQELTLKGKTIRHDFAMAVVLNKILGMGYTVDGFREAEGGRFYRYKVVT
jgi:hypothetical protein